MCISKILTELFLAFLSFLKIRVKFALVGKFLNCFVYFYALSAAADTMLKDIRNIPLFSINLENF